MLATIEMRPTENGRFWSYGHQNPEQNNNLSNFAQFPWGAGGVLNTRLLILLLGSDVEGGVTRKRITFHKHCTVHCSTMFS